MQQIPILGQTKGAPNMEHFYLLIQMMGSIKDDYRTLFGLEGVNVVEKYVSGDDGIVDSS